jgi:hypothetical protein
MSKLGKEKEEETKRMAAKKKRLEQEEQELKAIAEKRKKLHAREDKERQRRVH